QALFPDLPIGEVLGPIKTAAVGKSPPYRSKGDVLIDLCIEVHGLFLGKVGHLKKNGGLDPDVPPEHIAHREQVPPQIVELGRGIEDTSASQDIQNGRVGIEFKEIVGGPQVHIEITDRVLHPGHYGVGNHGLELGLVQAAQQYPGTQAKGQLVQGPE